MKGNIMSETLISAVRGADEHSVEQDATDSSKPTPGGPSATPETREGREAAEEEGEEA